MTTVRAPEVNARGDEEHPAFGMISAVRMSSTPGASLFDSDLRHNRTVRVTIHTATRKRELKHDFIHPERQIVEAEMSEAQWAAFVSSVGTSGVPVTLRHVAGQGHLPEIPFEPRLALSMAEVHSAAEAAFARIREAQAEVDRLAKTGTAKEKREAANHLRNVIGGATSNVDYATSQLTKHAENVVTKARADIEAMAAQHVERLAVEGGEPEPVSLPQIQA